MNDNTVVKPSNFIRNIIDEDIKNNKNGGKVHTRFPPEPNGYLHIGHAKSICLNFGIALDYANAKCNLRFDDTNPVKEDELFVQAIEKDVKWLGFDWEDRLFHASDYYQQFYDYAVTLIKKQKAYVCNLNAEEIREYRGTLTEPGKESPNRNRSVEENLDLFARMKNGEFEEGSHLLRAKIDMASPNINMRDPAIYRIRKVHHQRTGNDWCIYPMYDYAHCVSDSIEGITHSLCTLEFEDHRPLYDWYLDELAMPCHPQQIEFSRLNLEYSITSKRKLTMLVSENHVDGWDDPRMPTIAGMRRRGYPAAAIRDFCNRIGVTKSDNTIEMAVLENTVREDLDANAPRAMGVLNPIKVIITNYPDDQSESYELSNHPKEESFGKRKVPFSKVIYIDQADFAEVPPAKYKRLIPEGEVRLRGSYVIKCNGFSKADDGKIKELHCTYDAATLGAKPEGRKVKGVIHWVSAAAAIDAEIRLYDRLFTVPNPDADKDTEFTDHINTESLVTLHHCKVEASLATVKAGDIFQFEREGYFAADDESKPEKLIFNRTVTLRDTWANKGR